MKIRLLTRVVGVLFVMLSAGEAKSQTIKSGEYNIKAVFIYNFTRFVVWPETAFEHDDAPFTIAVLGPDPFAEKLESAVKGESVNGHPIVIERYNNWNDLRPSHILYVSADYPGEWSGGLSGLRENHTLTVSDRDGFARSGGMINFVTRENKIKLMINASAAKASALTISSKLLRLAEIVEGE